MGNVIGGVIQGVEGLNHLGNLTHPAVDKEAYREALNGKAAAWATYAALESFGVSRMSVIAGGSWTRCASPAAIGRGVSVADWVSDGEKQQSKMGAKKGNICGFVAACRVQKILGGENAPQMGWPFTTMWTAPEELEAYLNSDKVPSRLVCRHKAFDAREAQDYLQDIREQVASGRPTIVLVYESLQSQHYITVVAHDRDGGNFAVLDYGGLMVVPARTLLLMSFNFVLCAYRTLSVRRQ